MIAIIGGSGLTHLPELNITHRQIVRTPYGLPSSPVISGKLGNQFIVFLARHGLNHAMAPHEINYRANIWALHSLGVKEVISVSAVSAINPEIELGALVLPDDLVDYTYGRESTFFEGQDKEVVYTEFDPPYSTALRQVLLNHAAGRNAPILAHSVYGCLQGPRLPTRAELRRYRNDGVDIIGMTGMPEAILAKELKMDFAHLCGVIGQNDGQQHSPDFRSKHSHTAIQKIRQLLVDM